MPPASRSSSTCRSRWGMSRIFPSKQFAGKSRIGHYGDKMMEGDYHVGQILDALKDLGVDDDTIVIFASDNGPQGDDGARTRQQRHAGHGLQRPVPRRARRRDRGLDPDLRLHPLARPRQAGHDLLRHVLGDGLSADPRRHRRRQDADRPADRRRGPERRALRQERDRASRVAADLHRAGSGRRALEAVAHLLHATSTRPARARSGSAASSRRAAR